MPVNSHDVTDEQWEGLAQVVPLRGRDGLRTRLARTYYARTAVHDPCTHSIVYSLPISAHSWRILGYTLDATSLCRLLDKRRYTRVTLASDPLSCFFLVVDIEPVYLSCATTFLCTCLLGPLTNSFASQPLD